GLGRGQDIGDRAEVGEAVGAGGVGDVGDGPDDVAQVVGAGERDGDAGDALLDWRLEQAVVIEIVIDKTGEAGGIKLAEVVVHPIRAADDGDVIEQVVGGGSARCSDGVLPVQ